MSYKPKDYNSLSPYFIVDDAQKLVNQLKAVFNAEELRRYEQANGKIMHLELQLDDSVIMITDSTETYKAHTLMLHMYVEDVFKTFDKALANGCVLIDKPERKENDSDTRGSFYDCAGNYWSIGQQTHEE